MKIIKVVILMLGLAFLTTSCEKEEILYTDADIIKAELLKVIEENNIRRTTIRVEIVSGGYSYWSIFHWEKNFTIDDYFLTVDTKNYFIGNIYLYEITPASDYGKILDLYIK